jgi:hypothetical protein
MFDRSKLQLNRLVATDMIFSHWWPMQVETNLIQFEVTTLEEVGFILCEMCKNAPWIVFANENTPPNWLANQKCLAKSS